LLKDLFVPGRRLRHRYRSNGFWARDNRRFEHPGTAVRFFGQSDGDKIATFATSDTGPDHNRIAGRKKVHGQGKDQEHGNVTHHGSYQR
jgi:hypothetical protein